MDTGSLEPFLQIGVSEQPPESPIQEIIKAILRNQLAEEAKTQFFESCRVLKVLLKNIYNNPDEDKYRTIKLLNPKFNNNIGKYTSGLLILELLGFQQIPSEDPIMVYTFDTVDPLKEVINIVEKIIGRQELKPQEEVKFVPIKRKSSEKNKKLKDLDNQLKEYRNKQKHNGPDLNRNRTNNSIQRHEINDYSVTNAPNNQVIPRQQQNYVPPTNSNDLRMHQIYNTISSFQDPRNLMLRAHDLSNQFRASQGKLALVWNEGLCAIACEHSKDMGDGKVPFGHQGFKKRYQRFPIFNVRGGAENVAYNNSLSDPGKLSVDGWINSPGHRKNLLGHFHFMAVGVYTNAQGMHYFTQLFASI